MQETESRVELAGLFEELKRRKVFRILVAYLVAAWVLLQVAEVFSSILELPSWAPKLVLLLLALGLVPALILAWAYELTPDGIKRDADARHAPAPRPPGRRRTAGITIAAVLGVTAGAVLFWLSGSDERWARNVALPKIEQHIAASEWEPAYAVAMELQERVTDSDLLDGYWGEFTYKTTLPSSPEGATVYRRPYRDPQAEWLELGQTPIYEARIPRGFSLMRVELDGAETVNRIVGSMPIAGGAVSLGAEEDITGTEYVVPPVDIVLDPVGPLDSPEVRVPGTELLLDGKLVTLSDFRIGKYEVTNHEYKAFVDGGAYARRDLWEHDFDRDGREVTWDEAMTLFKDSTGRPGPSNWIGGTFPEGQENYPVGGISWYEAAAYARFAGRELPTVHHWRRAHAPAVMAWQVLESNLETSGPAPVGEYGGIGWTGTFDMLGNVREWCANALGDQRAIVGGAWHDLAYWIPETIRIPAILPPFDRSPQNGVRLASLRDTRGVKDVLQQPLKPEEIIEAPEPASDEAFSAILRNFDYSSSPLNASIDATGTIRNWERQEISFDSGDGQRTELILYLPDTKTSRHRTMVFWPSSIAILLPSLDEYRLHLDFMLRSGWAVAMPVFEQTFHRTDGEFPSTRTVTGRDLTIRQVRELRRTIDYLETRPDIDTESLAYYGFSWGAIMGPIALTAEPRLKVGVLNQAGIPRGRYYDIHPAHYLPRVQQPVLQFNGRYDTNFRYEDSAKPFFDRMGSESKKHVVDPTGHFSPMPTVIGETLAWLDEYLPAQ